MITHEITESYEGGKIGLKEGKSDFVKLENGVIKNPKSYSKAHNRAYPQNAIYYEKREVDGKIFRDYYVSDRSGNKTIIYTKEMKK